MDQEAKTSPLKLIWVYTDSLADQLDASTWLDTTQELRRLGWDVTLITAGNKDQDEIDGVPVTTITPKNIYLIRQVIFHIQVLSLIFKNWKIVDVILFHQMSAPWLLPLKWIRKMTGRLRPLIIMDTRTLPMIPSEVGTFKDRIRNKFDGLMNFLANHLADGQTAITGKMAEAMKIPQTQLFGIWPSGVDIEVFEPARIARDWDPIKDEVRLVYIGALHNQRKLMVMCEAIEAANASGKNFIFTMVGWGPEREQLAKFALKTDGRIRVFPAVPHDQIPQLLADAHVGVLPFPNEQRYRVSSPIKLFEYMAAGLPILATKIDCHTDVIKDGDYAFWSENVSVAAHLTALAHLWEKRNELPLLGEKSAVDAVNWTWKASASKLDAALRVGLNSS